MVKVEKISRHDKKKNKYWSAVTGYKNNIRFFGIFLTELDSISHKVCWIKTHFTQEWEEKEGKKLELQEGQNIEHLFNKEDIQTIFNEITKVVKE